MLHALKCIQPYFKHVQDGFKNFEVRKDDRPFEPGDEIVLQEWDEEKKQYTGKEWKGVITMIMRDERFCKKGFCIFGIQPNKTDNTDY